MDNPNKGKLEYVTVYYTNGDITSTSMSKDLTDQEVRDYFRVGKVFNVGYGGRDRLTKVKKVTIHRYK